jgi:osmotically-inducible protein OsmY
MNSKHIGAISLALVLAMGLSKTIEAQNAPTGSESSQFSGNDMAARVKQALHSDPALYDKHIDVSMEKGKVVLRGFVDSAGDLQKAVRTANKTVGEKNVVSDLTIKTRDATNSSGN